jgi:hypothetical protein
MSTQPVWYKQQVTYSNRHLRNISEKGHDAHSDPSGTKVQADGDVALLNSEFRFSTIFTVVPPPPVPNSRSGVILGQNEFIDRMVYAETPKATLKHHMEDIKEDEWGTIDISE